MPVNSATAASALASSTSAPKISFREAPTARATTTSPLRAAVRARCSASSVAAPTASVSSAAPRTIDSSCSNASCCTCGQTTAFEPQSASIAGTSPSAIVKGGAAGVPPRSVSAGIIPVMVSAAVSATRVPVPACQRSARAAALRRAICELMRTRSGDCQAIRLLRSDTASASTGWRAEDHASLPRVTEPVWPPRSAVAHAPETRVCHARRVSTPPTTDSSGHARSVAPPHAAFRSSPPE